MIGFIFKIKKTNHLIILCILFITFDYYYAFIYKSPKIKNIEEVKINL